jgi:hypothetical protein
MMGGFYGSEYSKMDVYNPSGHSGRLQINSGFDFDFEHKIRVQKTFSNFWVLVLYILKFIMQKNKSRTIIFSTPTSATTLFITVTLIIAPTVSLCHLPTYVLVPAYACSCAQQKKIWAW